MHAFFISTLKSQTRLIYAYKNIRSSPPEVSLQKGVLKIYSNFLVGHPSSDGIMLKIPYGVDVLLHLPASHLKTKSDFIVGSVESGLGK